MTNTWLLVANGSAARLFQTEQNPKTLTLLQDFFHPESREKASELTSDKMGHYQGDAGTGYGSFNEATDPKDHEMERFAAELVQTLEAGRTANSFKHLIIASSPRFHGLLNQKMNGHLGKMVERHINKDLTAVNERELLARLQDSPAQHPRVTD